MSQSDFDIIQQNVPEASMDQIFKAYLENKKNIADTICALMNIQEKPIKEKTEWEKRRDICDEYDAEVQKYLKQLRGAGMEQNGVLNVPIPVPSKNNVATSIQQINENITINPIINLNP